MNIWYKSLIINSFLMRKRNWMRLGAFVRQEGSRGGWRCVECGWVSSKFTRSKFLWLHVMTDCNFVPRRHNCLTAYLKMKFVGSP